LPGHAEVVANAQRNSGAGERPARTMGRFTLLEELGSGSMGVVYRAQDAASGEHVALKLLRAPGSSGLHATLVALFQREYHTLARLKHPRIIEVHEYGQSEQGHYYTMELLDGKDLRELAPLPVSEACRHLRDIASSLALLHAHRLVHRDVTASNVRLGRGGRVKLIDFGALATFGPARDVIGTAPSVAPEVLNWMPLDQRADLFALGALFYWTLTGRHAYPARKLDELPAMWERRVAPPSSLAEGISGALDELVMSLLSLQPLARPASAALVIDRINAIACLAPEDETHAAQSYLSSSPMVGREPELQLLTAHAQAARGGAGASALIEGAAGAGKTRLLHELCLAAQITGLLAIRVDAESATGSFGVIEALIDGALRMAPEEALQAARPHAALLAHLSAPLARRLEVREPERLPDDLGERRARLQTALHAWFLALARRRPLLLAIDNLHAADDSSAACIAALAREADRNALFLLSSLRADRQSSAPLAVDAVLQKSQRLKLTGLDRSASEELLKGLFGPVSNTGRLAAWLFERSAGNPHHAMRLVQELVGKGIARYVDGTWVLPLDIAEHELPGRLDELLGARLAQLSPRARELAQALAVHGKPLRIERCLPLVRGASPPEVHGALDELVAEEFIVCEDGEFHFVQDAAREAVLSGIEEARRSAMHRQVAEVLLATAGSDVRIQFEAAWHLLHGGERARGAELLAEVARKLVTDADGVENDARLLVRALLAALEVYEEQRRSDYELAPLLLALMPLSFYVDWRLATRHGERALEIGFRISGLTLAHKLRRFVGRKAGLFAGLLIAALRFKRRQRAGLSFTLREAIVGTMSAVPSVAGFFSVCLDRAGGERVLRLVEPLTLFGADHVAGAIHAGAVARLMLSSGCELEAEQLLERNCARAADPEFGRDLNEARRRGLHAGELLPLAVLQSYRGGDGALQIADKLAQLGIRLFAMAADQLRLMHYALRGELERAAEFQERTELHVLQGGTTWQTDVFLPAHMFMAAMLTEDALGLRQAWEQLARQAKEIPSLEVYAEAAHAGYLAARGDGREALAQLELLVTRLPPRQRIGWAVVRLNLAQLLNRGGDHARAKEVVLEVTSRLSPADYDFVFPYLDSQRHLALAELGLGNFAEAVRILDGLLAEPRAPDHPLWLGLLHKARAQVALRQGDGEAFRRHLAQLEHWFRATRNPCLITQWERLAAAGAALGLCEHARGAGSEGPPLPSLASGTELARLLARCADHERLPQALDLLVNGSGARAGYMYGLRGGALELLAAQPDGEAPAAVREALQELLEEARIKLLSLRPGPRVAAAASHPDQVRTETSFEQTVKERQAGEHRLLVLAAGSGAGGEVVGGIALELAAGMRSRFATEHLTALAELVRGAALM
jgi:hypothetical protein